MVSKLLSSSLEMLWRSDTSGVVGSMLVVLSEQTQGRRDCVNREGGATG